MSFSSFAHNGLIFKNRYFRLTLFLVAILISGNVFPQDFELVPSGQVLELINSKEMTDLLNNGKNIRNEIFDRARALCESIDRDFLSLTYANAQTKRKYFCQKTDINKVSSTSEDVTKISKAAEHTKAFGFALFITCGLFLVLPSSLCDFYCPASYYDYAHYGAIVGLVGMIGGIFAHLSTTWNENYERCCPKNDYSDREMNLSYSDGEEDVDGYLNDEKNKQGFCENNEPKDGPENKGPRPVLLRSIKCI